MAVTSIVRDPLPGGAWLVLPPRVVPRAMAWVMLGVGLAVTCFMLFWMHGASGGWRYRSAGDLIPIVFGLLGLPGLAFGVGVLALGVGLLRGWSRCRVGVLATEVLVREELGLAHWTRRVPRAALRGVIVREAEQMQSAVLLRCHDRADVRCAIGYPVEQLAELADGLGSLLGSDAPLAAADHAPPPGNLQVDEAGDRVAIALTGRRQWVPLAVFTMLWLGFVGVFSAVALGFIGSKPSSWTMLAFTLPFWAAGIGLAVLCVHMRTHSVSLLWDGAALTLIDRSALRRRIRTWRPEELSAILVSERGSGSGRYRVVALRQRQGGDHDLGMGLDAESQLWIAARLRRALGVQG